MNRTPLPGPQSEGGWGSPAREGRVVGSARAAARLRTRPRLQRADPERGRTRRRESTVEGRKADDPRPGCRVGSVAHRVRRSPLHRAGRFPFSPGTVGGTPVSRGGPSDWKKKSLSSKV